MDYIGITIGADTTHLERLTKALEAVRELKDELPWREEDLSRLASEIEAVIRDLRAKVKTDP